MRIDGAGEMEPSTEPFALKRGPGQTSLAVRSPAPRLKAQSNARVRWRLVGKLALRVGCEPSDPGWLGRIQNHLGSKTSGPKLRASSWLGCEPSDRVRRFLGSEPSGRLRRCLGSEPSGSLRRCLGCEPSGRFRPKRRPSGGIRFEPSAQCKQVGCQHGQGQVAGSGPGLARGVAQALGHGDGSSCVGP